MGCGASTYSPADSEILESVPVVLPSVPVTGIRQPHELTQPVIAPTSPSAATIQRRSLQKSRPFWEIQADAKRKAEEQERTRTPSPTSSENDELDAVIINEVRSMVARALSRVTLPRDRSPALPRTARLVEPIERPLPVTEPPPPIERPLPVVNDGEMCDRNGCGCGGEAPPAIEPMAWIDALPTEAAKKVELGWLSKLSSEQFRVLRMKGTEEIHTGEYNEYFEEGSYACAACAKPLYASEHKFKSGHGWPAFFDNYPGALTRIEHGKNARKKIEVVCSGCGAHVGHVFFSKRYPKPTHERHCVNSISLAFAPPGGFFIAAEDNVEARGELD